MKRKRISIDDFKNSHFISTEYIDRDSNFKKELCGNTNVDNMILEITPDENYNLSSSHKALRWDKNKKKYIQKNIDINGKTVDMTKNESGQKIKNGKKKIV